MNIGHPTNNGLPDGVMIWTNPPEGMRTWPRPVKTDDQGRATMTGIGRGLNVVLTVRDLRYAQQHLHIDPRTEAAEKETTHALRSAKIIEGRVLAADTGSPVPNAMISIAAAESEFGSMLTTRFRADVQGHYTANPTAGEYFRVYAYAPEGQPYLVPEVEVPWTKGAVKKALDIRVPRGIVIRGKVTEAGTNRPLAGANIQFVPVGYQSPEHTISGWQAMTASRADGSFQVVVPPRKGHLLVFGPTPDYVARRSARTASTATSPAARATEPTPSSPMMPRRATRPESSPWPCGPARRSRAGSRDPTARRSRWPRSSRRSISACSTPSGGFTASHGPRRPLRAARPRPGEAHAGLDPRRRTPVGHDARCLRQARRRGPDDPPPAERPGESPVRRPRRQAGRQASAPLRDRRHSRPVQYEPGREGPGRAVRRCRVRRQHRPQALLDDPATDAEGRITLIDLIPGALYRIIDFSTVRDPKKGPQVRKDFTVKPGETFDLGDILIEKP